MIKIPYSKKRAALEILKNLLRCLKSLKADILYAALCDAGFTEGERSRLVGSSFRKAACLGWITRTSFCVPSCRNHSNLQRVWISNLFPKFAKSGFEAEKKIMAAYTYWESNDLAPPDDLAEKWQGC